MKRLILTSIACVCAFAFTSCGPLDGGDPLDGPPASDGGTLNIRPDPQEGVSRSIGVEGRYDRYGR
jgi:hypothetical protein